MVSFELSCSETISTLDLVHKLMYDMQNNMNVEFLH